MADTQPSPRTRTLRTRAVAALAAVAGAAALVAVPAATGAATAGAAYCGITWGSLAKTSGTLVGFTTFRQVRWAGSFEGYTTVALGVRARLPFRAFTVYDASTNRSRLVVDVAHHW